MADTLKRMPCPNCGQRIKYGAADAGTEAFCPHCDTSVVLEGSEAVESAAPPPPVPSAGAGRLKLIAIPVVAFIAVFGLITTVAIMVKSGNKKRTKVVMVDGREEVVEVEDATPRKASPKVKKLAGYKRPLKPIKKQKLVFSNPTPRKGGDPTQLLGHKVIKAELGSMQYVVGIVTNHTGKRFFDVEVFFDLYDDKGKKTGEAKDYLGILSPNGSWELKATVFARGATSAKLRKIDKQAE
jgi:hypothetical protein